MREKLKKIVDEVGGPEKIESILRAFYSQMEKDILVGYFFSGKNLEHIILQQKSFFLRSAGITPSYSGKSPARAHDQLPKILKGHFDRRLVLLKQTLESFGLSQESIRDWISFEESFRKAIVEEEA